jgi:hypothetical protein
MLLTLLTTVQLKVKVVMVVLVVMQFTVLYPQLLAITAQREVLRLEGSLPARLLTTALSMAAAVAVAGVVAGGAQG